jgi:hypothetical protein
MRVYVVGTNATSLADFTIGRLHTVLIIGYEKLRNMVFHLYLRKTRSLRLTLTLSFAMKDIDSRTVLRP